MEIRPANENDFEDVRAVARRAWTVAYEDLLDEETVEETVDEWYGDDALADAIHRPGTVLLVATDDDLVGFCHGVCHDDEGDVLRLSVDPDRWNEGIGTALYERLRGDLLDLNMKRMQAMVLADDETGTAFFEERGFDATDEGEVELGGQRYREVVYTQQLDRARA